MVACKHSTDAPNSHHHTFAEDWTRDETYHWHASTCGHDVTDSKAAHTYGEYVSNNDATTKADGTKTRECSVCGHEDTIVDEGSKIVYKVGDIILTDGSKVSVENVDNYSIDENNKPVGVIAMTSDDVVKIIGLQQGSSLIWAADSTQGNKITNIVAEFTGSTASGYTFTGDEDGSDNWKEICAVDSTGTNNAATNYPIFNFANTYGTKAGLTNTAYETGWYVPSVKELYDVSLEREKIQKSLTQAGGFTFANEFYWSSSQGTKSTGYASLVQIFENRPYENAKALTVKYVLVLKNLSID